MPCHYRTHQMSAPPRWFLSTPFTLRHNLSTYIVSRSGCRIYAKLSVRLIVTRWDKLPAQIETAGHRLFYEQTIHGSRPICTIPMDKNHHWSLNLCDALTTRGPYPVHVQTELTCRPFRQWHFSTFEMQKRPSHLHVLPTMHLAFLSFISYVSQVCERCFHDFGKKNKPLMQPLTAFAVHSCGFNAITVFKWALNPYDT